MPADTIILVHGAWHGGWCWDRVRPALEAAGHTVIAPTLPGLEPKATGSEPPSLEDHVQSVVEAIHAADGRVLLVGHSYGGMVVTAAADRARDRIAGVVYLDAAVPANGRSFASHIPGIDAEAIARREGAFRHMAGGGDWLPAPAFDTIGISDETDKEWLGPLLVPHPVRTWLEPVSISEAGLEGVPRTYVLATDPPTTIMGYPLHGEVAKSAPGWTYREVATGHEMMVTEPDRTADVILEAARA